MRKTIIFALAALMLLTAQCKKNEPKPESQEDMVMVPIRGIVSFDQGGSKTDITTAGYVTPADGDVIYIYYGGTYKGSLTCTTGIGQLFTCSGTIDASCLGKECVFMYLGSDNGLTSTSTTISFANQTTVGIDGGRITGINKFHVGSCKATVSAEGTVALPMLTKMAIGYFQLREGDTPIASANVTISGLYSAATINKNEGTLIGSTSGNITVTTDANGCFFMALVPKSGAVTFSFAIAGYENASKNFSNGIRACRLYTADGVSSPIEVSMAMSPILSGTFSVGASSTVRFSRGNVQYLGNSDGTGTWRLADHQWDVLGNGPSGIGDENHGNVDLSSRGYTTSGHYNYASKLETPTAEDKASARDLFGWGCTGTKDNRAVSTNYQTQWQPYSTYYTTSSECYGPSCNYTSQTWYQDLLVESESDWGKCFSALSLRLLRNTEWEYIQNSRSGTKAPDINGYTDCRYAMVKVNGWNGMMLFPDVFTWPNDVTVAPPDNFNSSTYNDRNYEGSDFKKLEMAGAVFLPAAGKRDSNPVNNVNSTSLYYWSSSRLENSAYGGDKTREFSRQAFDYKSVRIGNRSYGYAVRLVR